LEAQQNYLQNLNDKQLEAVLHSDGPILILAGAGTGKTKVLTSRIIHLIASGKAYPSQILGVTFTNKAAREMVERIAVHVSDGLGWLGTFHSISVKMLRSHADKFSLSPSFSIINADDQLRVIKNLLQENNIDDKDFPPKLVLAIIQRWKDLGLKPQELSISDLKKPAHHKAKFIYHQYQDRLRMLDAVDFGDLLLFAIDLLTNFSEVQEYYHQKFKYILVDEYQDTNVAQYMWLRLITNNHKNICCVGDEDQSIYGWRGAEIGNILRFEKEFKDTLVVRLEQNYRSTNNILNSASSLIAHNSERLGKNLWSAAGNGEPIKLVTLWDENAEAKYIAKAIGDEIRLGKSYNNIAVLVRATFQTRNIEESLLSYAIPYKIIGGLKFYDRLEIRDIVSYIRASINPNDSIATERIINVPKRGIGPTTVREIAYYAQSHNISLQYAIKEMIESKQLKGKNATTLSDLLEKFAEWRNSLMHNPIEQAIERVILESGYLQMWKMLNTPESQGKIENIKELLNAVRDFHTVHEFIEHVSLVTDNENASNENTVSVMTIHAAKGLEFDTVILPGLEESIFPHQRSLEDGSIEEERRLAYVAITRAKSNLHITKTLSRKIFGKWQTTIPSRFLAELPESAIKKIEVSYNNYSETSYQSYRPKTTYNYANTRNFKIGDRVTHDKFGEGYVLSMSDDQVEVAFDNIGIKRLLESFVRKK
jgi:DNA helicase-2/ATP-dependent DNA helicase PcrA